MSKLKALFQKAWTTVTNPGQDERVQRIVAAIGQDLKTKKAAFELDATLEPIECTKQDVKVATLQYYNSLLEKYWENGVPTEQQQKTLAWIASKLRIASDDVRKINRDAAITFFQVQLVSYLEDGVISSEEQQELNSIAKVAGMTVQEMVRHFGSESCLEILRNLFAATISTGKFEQTFWENLKQSITKLGIPYDEWLQSIRPLATSFVEHTLADSKSDGKITQSEEIYVAWLLKSFQLGADFTAYVSLEIANVKKLEKILSGHLPIIEKPRELNLGAAESVHFQAPSFLVIQRRSNDPDLHNGTVYLTDSRIVFDSQTKPLSIPYSAILSSRTLSQGFSLSLKNKPEISINFPNPEAFSSEIFETLLRLHNQQLRKRSEGVPDRHIPRDVRQRVWTRYSGRCADCSATDYLEFDHIVPVAKGGSNSDQNVQLLCRKCNLKKSDKI